MQSMFSNHNEIKLEIRSDDIWKNSELFRK